jgi:hypothetical protein
MQGIASPALVHAALAYEALRNGLPRRSPADPGVGRHKGVEAARTLRSRRTRYRGMFRGSRLRRFDTVPPKPDDGA